MMSDKVAYLVAISQGEGQAVKQGEHRPSSTD
jgi:hypothetical protein